MVYFSFFQEYIPVISILCNPGIRDRHWIKMSEIAEKDITPDSGTTLRKVLKQELMPFMEEFETISGAASKVKPFPLALFSGKFSIFMSRVLFPLLIWIVVSGIFFGKGHVENERRMGVDSIQFDRL